MARGIQTDEAGIMKCNCEIKYQKIFEDYKESLESEHKEDKDGALEELSERVSFMIYLYLRTTRRVWSRSTRRTKMAPSRNSGKG